VSNRCATLRKHVPKHSHLGCAYEKLVRDVGLYRWWNTRVEVPGP